MPVVLAPADPVAPNISAGYGATEQFDKTLPVLAGLYEANQRNNLAASQGLAQRNLQAQQATAQNRDRAYQTDVEDSARFEQQRQQAAVGAEMQSRQQAFQTAMRDRELTAADEQQYYRQQRALTGIQEAVQNGTLTQEEAGPEALRIKTGIDLYKQRKDKESADNQSALEKLHLQQAARTAKVMDLNANMSVENFSKNTVTTLDPQAEQAERDKLRPKYQALAAVIGAEEAQQAMDQEVRRNVIGSGRYEQKTFEGYDSHGQPRFSRVEHTKPNPGHDKDLFNSQLKHFETSDKTWQADQSRYDREHKAARAEANKLSAENGGWSQEKVKSETERLLADQGVKPPGPRPTMPSRPDQQQTQASNQPTGQTAQPNTAGQQAQADTDQRGESAAPPNATDFLDQKAKTLGDLNQFTVRLGVIKKQEYTEAIGRLRNLVEKYRGAKDIPDDVRAEMENLKRKVYEIPS